VSDLTDEQIANLLDGYDGPEDCTIRLAREVRRRRQEDAEAIASWDAFDVAAKEAERLAEERYEAGAARERAARFYSRDE
jgi:hypothetical protein